jgi:hypothetical protein
MLRACPAFQISVFDHSKTPNRIIFDNYETLYNPKQIWIESALLPSGGIRDTWPQEFYSQIQDFFERWVHKEPTIEWHIESKELKRERITRVTISALPPQMDSIPLEITLSDKKNQIKHEREWFVGAECSYDFQLSFKPSFVSSLQYFNIEKTDSDKLKWIKHDAQQALERTVDTITSLDLSDLVSHEKRFFKMKEEILIDVENSL